MVKFVVLCPYKTLIFRNCVNVSFFGGPTTVLVEEKYGVEESPHWGGGGKAPKIAKAGRK